MKVMTRAKLFALGLCLLLPTSAALAQDEEEEFFEEEAPLVDVSTVLDFRYIYTDTTTGWLDRGLGKTRYGGEDGESRNLFRVPTASFVLDLNPASTFSAHVQLNIDAEPEFPGGRFGWDRLRLIEAFATWSPTLNEAGTAEIRVKGGFFFPHISLEHIGEAWSTVYSITPSALNAWVGEELRSTGVETTFAHLGLENEFSIGGAAFWVNDPTGSLLAWRGFAAHDRQTGWRDRVPLAPLPSIQPRTPTALPPMPMPMDPMYPEYDPEYPDGMPPQPPSGPDGSFPNQAPWVEPFLEIDDRVGYYINGAWQNYQWFEVNALYYDNRGNPTVRNDEGQYAWDTRFTNIGAVAFLPGEIEILGAAHDRQHLHGLPRAAEPGERGLPLVVPSRQHPRGAPPVLGALRGHPRPRRRRVRAPGSGRRGRRHLDLRLLVRHLR